MKFALASRQHCAHGVQQQFSGRAGRRHLWNSLQACHEHVLWGLQTLHCVFLICTLLVVLVLT